MCGIAGLWLPKEDITLSNIAEEMCVSLKHRGPDGDGVWIDNLQRLTLVHTRLSIQDLSQAGAQPMPSPCGRFMLVFNGEIYNHLTLRSILSNEVEITWTSSSDTETLLHALVIWGVQKTLSVVNGMFAFGFYDSCEEQLVVARDRFGEKPLYYGNSGGNFIFGSELKPFVKTPNWKGKINRNVLAKYCRDGYVASPNCIYNGLYKLEPGTFLTVTFAGQVKSSITRYYDSYCEYKASSSDPSENLPLDKLDELLRSSVDMRLISDVPIGCFLSGGIDSSLITAIMNDVSNRSVSTFSLGFHDADFDEAVHASRIAKYLNTNHRQIYIKEDDALEVIDLLPVIYDEPFSDSSQIPTYLISKFAREHVKVCLSGDGGDELFFGYNRYLRSEKIWNFARLFNSNMRPVLFKGIMGGVSSISNDYMKSWKHNEVFGKLNHRIKKLSDALNSTSKTEVFQKLTQLNPDAINLVKGVSTFGTESTPSFEGDMSLDPRKGMMLSDIAGYLPDDILTKVDRATMSNGLEARVPFLDPNLVHFALGLSVDNNLSNGKGKMLLRKLLTRYLPDELIHSKKKGFSIPLDKWLRGELFEWATDLLNPQKLEDQGLFEVEVVIKMWNDHIEGSARWEYQLWTILMFQSWLDNQEVFS